MLAADAAGAIIAAGRRMDGRGWVPATAGNLSLRLADGRIAITRSGAHKGYLAEADVLLLGADGAALSTTARSSYETPLHLGIYRRFPEAGAILHGHSLAGTVLTRRGGEHIALSDYELLKAFPGSDTHAARCTLPILDNDQDIPRLQAALDAIWDRLHSIPPGYLIRGHGTTIWAADMPTALARLEALEFMLACELHERRHP